MAAVHLPPKPWSGRSDPEDGDHAIRLHHLVKDDAPRALIGFACDAGVRRNKGRIGARDGPAALRKALANLAAPEDGAAFSDLGDVEVTNDELEAGQTLFAEKLGNALGKHERIIGLGGGHETAFGSYSGLSKAFPDAKIGIINLDAHLDIRLMSENGPSSGTPFTQIRDLNPDAFDYLCIGLAEEANTVALLKRAADWGVDIISDHAMLAEESAANRAIEAMIERSDIIYLTICLDVLSHYQAPGVSAPAARGLPLSTVEYVIARVLSRCAALDRAIPLADVVELSPPNDTNDMTAKTAALFIRRLLFS